MKAFVLVLSCLTFLSCKHREYNSSAQRDSGVVSPDSPEAVEKPWVATGKAYYTISEFENAFHAAFIGAFKSHGYKVTSMLPFTYEDSLQDGATLTPTQFRKMFFPSDNALQSILDKSVEAPQTSFKQSGRMPLGGFTLFRGDIYPEGFFREQKEALPSLQALMTQKPWFMWDRASKRFVFRTDGMQEHLLGRLFELTPQSQTISLYRGGKDAEMASQPMSVASARNFKPGEVPFVFTSPLERTGVMWAHPLVQRSDILKTDLLRVASGANATVYIGIEYQYIEIAFLQAPPALDLWVKNRKAHCRRKGADGYEAAFHPPVPDCPAF